MGPDRGHPVPGLRNPNGHSPKKEEMEGYNIDNEVIKYIATNIKSNIRELEGALTKIVALSRLNKCDITLELAEEALKDIISPNAQREVTPELIIQVVSDHFGITPADVISQKRTKDIVYPRQIIMYLCRTMTETSLQIIGRSLGKGIIPLFSTVLIRLPATCRRMRPYEIRSIY